MKNMETIENFFLRQAEEHLNSMGFVGAVVKEVAMDDFGWPIFLIEYDGAQATMRAQVTYGVPKFPKIERPCRFDGCLMKVTSLGYCQGHYRMHNLGLPLKKLRKYREDLTVAEQEQLVGLVQDGYSIARVGEMLNMNMSAVSRAYYRITGQHIKEWRKVKGLRMRIDE
jgi:hypothetical protein